MVNIGAKFPLRKTFNLNTVLFFALKEKAKKEGVRTGVILRRAIKNECADELDGLEYEF